MAQRVLLVNAAFKRNSDIQQFTPIVILAGYHFIAGNVNYFCNALVPNWNLLTCDNLRDMER